MTVKSSTTVTCDNCGKNVTIETGGTETIYLPPSWCSLGKNSGYIYIRAIVNGREIPSLWNFCSEACMTEWQDKQIESDGND